jgi:hypothetical protein
VATTFSVYEHFGLPLNDATRAAVAETDAASRTAERHPAHTYALEDFGLTESDVAARFSGTMEA